MLDTAYDAGLSGPGQLHDLFVTHESLTPDEWKSKVPVKTSFMDGIRGPLASLIVASEQGVCGLAFELEDGRDATIDNLFRSLGEARRLQDDAATKRFADRAFDGGELNVVLRGTRFPAESLGRPVADTLRRSYQL